MQKDEFFDAADIKALKQSDDVAVRHALVHAVGVVGILVGGFTNPIVHPISLLLIWIVSNAFKKQYPSVKEHSHKALNFHITLFCCFLVLLGLLFGSYTWLRWGTWLLFLSFPILIFSSIGLCIYKATEAHKGKEATDYPFAYPFFKQPKM